MYRDLSMCKFSQNRDETIKEENVCKFIKILPHCALPLLLSSEFFNVVTHLNLYSTQLETRLKRSYSIRWKMFKYRESWYCWKHCEHKFRSLRTINFISAIFKLGEHLIWRSTKLGNLHQITGNISSARLSTDKVR